MPDNQDNQALGRLLATPETWTTAEAESARALLEGQKAAVLAVHSKDERRRASMQEVVDQLATALLIYEHR